MWRKNFEVGDSRMQRNMKSIKTETKSRKQMNYDCCSNKPHNSPFKDQAYYMSGIGEFPQATVRICLYQDY